MISKAFIVGLITGLAYGCAVHTMFPNDAGKAWMLVALIVIGEAAGNLILRMRYDRFV